MGGGAVIDVVMGDCGWARAKHPEREKRPIHGSRWSSPINSGNSTLIFNTKNGRENHSARGYKNETILDRGPECHSCITPK